MNDNKVWFITGASKGLGLALVKRLLNEGYQVAATSRNKASLVEAIGPENKNFLPLEVNLSSEESLKLAVASTISHFKTIDVLVNNAGYGQGGAVEEVNDEEVRKNYEVNVFGMLNVTRAILPIMRKQKSGHVFNISSIGGYVGAFSGWGIYCSTKFAVSAISEGLHSDVKDLGIKVTLIYPGYFRTNFLDNESMMTPSSPIAEYQSARDSMDYHKNTINKNQPGDPEKAAGVLIQLSKEKNPPLHMFLGTDAVDLAEKKMENFSKEVSDWRKTSVSTDF